MAKKKTETAKSKGKAAETEAAEAKAAESQESKAGEKSGAKKTSSKKKAPSKKKTSGKKTSGKKTSAKKSSAEKASGKKTSGKKKASGKKTSKKKETKSTTKKSSSKPTSAQSASGNGHRPRLVERYRDEVVPKLMKEFGIENPMGVPKITKISLNMGLGEAIENIKILDDAVEELSMLAGQRPTITRAHKSIANFKVREGMPIGCRVTLRDERMWAFLDRLITIALPRVRDFRGVSTKSFDGRGNYTLGIQDHLIFPEVDYNKVERSKGLNVTIVTTAGTDERAFYLLRELGMPFRR